MGMIYSAFCMISFCFERVMTWACCACALMSLLSMIMILMVYGISIGYGYAQQELAGFAKKSREHLTDMWMNDPSKSPQYPHTPWRRRRRSGDNASEPLFQPRAAAAGYKAPLAVPKRLQKVYANRDNRNGEVPVATPDIPDLPYETTEDTYAPAEVRETHLNPDIHEIQQDSDTFDAREAQNTQDASAAGEAPENIPENAESITHVPIMEPKSSPFIIFPTERPPEEPETMQPHEKELARRIIGRFRRAKHFTDTPKMLM